MLSVPDTRRLGDVLQRADYVDLLSREPADPAVRIRRVAPASASRTLLALFDAGISVPSEDATSVFGAALFDDAVAGGLLAQEGQSVTARYHVSTYDGLLLAHDAGPPTRPDYVGGVNPAAHTLASLTPRDRVDAALDVGTGSGYQALLLARNAGRVVATDILPRALALTAFNAELNGVANIECREGSFFEPVAGERFDVIVCNPPFIVSPDADYAFRDAAMPGDSVSHHVLTTVPEHLHEHGRAAVVVNWGVRPGQAWNDAGSEWLTGRGCDAILIRWDVSDPLPYAAMWNMHLRDARPDDYAAALDRWTGYLAELGFDAIAQVGVLLRKRSASVWTRPYEAVVGPSKAAPEQIDRMFAARDFLDAHDGRLLDSRLTLVEGHQLDQSMRFVDSRYEIPAATMTMPQGLGLAGSVPAGLIPLLFGLTDDTLRKVIAAFADAVDGDIDVIQQEAVEMLTALVEIGLVVPATGP